MAGPNLSAVTADIIHDEGFRARVYDDRTGIPLGILPSGGHATAGYGFELSVNGLTVAESLLILHSRIQGRCKELDAALPWWRTLDEVRCGVLLNVSFNLGVPRLLGFHKMLAALQAKDYELAACELLDSDAARENVARYLRLSNQLRTGVK